ncbi:hypothetical protein [Streptomyces ipomoeae]|uniref:hypothetical protein n=1 Tax=Streptomyces ipomoeae TaxID=103232 RepID=UPI0011477F6F|nr:hypothetical protein [Streptomyces ipomoeae]TQE33176.1 hypothetical protein Sipo7851_22045 [Streptomyces ipomoeae]
MSKSPSQQFQPDIDDDGFYAERIVFTGGREGETRIYTGAAVRERIDAMTYTDFGEDWVYKTVSQDPETRVITGVTTTSPAVDAHHTATWTPITPEEKDAFQRARAAERQRMWQVVASVGA